MTSYGGSWRIRRIANEARRTIESLDLDIQERVLDELDRLQQDPFSGDIKRIKGKPDIFRLRFGKFRIYFRMIPSSRLIEVLLFDQRGSIKDKTIQRL